MTVICNVAVHVLAALLALPGAKMSLTLSIRNSITTSIRRLTGSKARTVAQNAATDSLTAIAEHCDVNTLHEPIRDLEPIVESDSFKFASLVQLPLTEQLSRLRSRSAFWLRAT